MSILIRADTPEQTIKEIQVWLRDRATFFEDRADGNRREKDRIYDRAMASGYAIAAQSLNDVVILPVETEVQS